MRGRQAGFRGDHGVKGAPREGAVAVTREAILRHDLPLDVTSTLSTAQFHAASGGRRLMPRPEASADRRTLILFHWEPQPSGVGLGDASGGEIDHDGAGQPGGTFVLKCETASIMGLPESRVE